MLVMISYAVVDDSKRLRLMKFLKDYGTRVQKSVFECNVEAEGFKDLKTKVEEIIEPIEDRVRYYALCEKCAKDVERSGKGEEFQEDEEYLVL